MIEITPQIQLDPSELRMTFIRASGPGGQNVNKVATVVQLRFDAASSPSLPETVRQRLLRLAGSRATADGEIVIEAKRFRTQARNREDAQERLVALIEQVKAPDPQQNTRKDGYSIITEILSPFDRKVERIFVITSIAEPIEPVFSHSFEHSLISAFQANGIDATMKVTSKESGSRTDYGSEAETFAPDANMRINIDPLYRKHKDGYQAIVGTDFEASAINMATENMVWHATGKVDYIANSYFKRSGYTAHEGIRKEFAWHTTAAIVRAFIADVNGRESAPIYTVTEDRQRHGERTD